MLLYFFPVDAMCQGFSKGPMTHDGLVSCELTHSLSFQDDPNYNCFLGCTSHFIDCTNILFSYCVFRQDVSLFVNSHFSLNISIVSLNVYNNFCFSLFPDTIYNVVSGMKNDTEGIAAIGNTTDNNSTI